MLKSLESPFEKSRRKVPSKSPFEKSLRKVPSQSPFAKSLRSPRARLAPPPPAPPRPPRRERRGWVAPAPADPVRPRTATAAAERHVAPPGRHPPKIALTYINLPLKKATPVYYRIKSPFFQKRKTPPSFAHTRDRARRKATAISRSCSWRLSSRAKRSPGFCVHPKVKRSAPAPLLPQPHT